jgi:BRCA1-associated protein
MFIKSITFQTPTHPNASFPELSHDPFTPSAAAASFMKPFPPPTPNLVELPTCPVCLERMDDTTGLLTILCQHVFHCDCLQKWRGTGCPVCRHTNPSLASQLPSASSSSDPANPPFGSSDASLCTICDCADDLWICLICGNVGCGRYKGGHAKQHWKNSAHNFALEIETQHVWDYAGDLWVHRLIRDKGDSKVIELPSGRPGRGPDDMVPREKLEAISIEYTHLLTSQLESQRVYFEELVGKAVAKASAASAAASNATSRADEAVAHLEALRLEHTRLRDDVVAGLEKELARERRKAERSAELARGFGQSLKEEKKVSEGLMKRIEHVNGTVTALTRELEEAQREGREMREENRDLLFAVTGGAKLRGLGLGGPFELGEIEGGTLSLLSGGEKEEEEKEEKKEKKRAGGSRRGRGRGKGGKEREHEKGNVEVKEKGSGRERGKEKESEKGKEKEK